MRSPDSDAAVLLDFARMCKAMQKVAANQPVALTFGLAGDLAERIADGLVEHDVTMAEQAHKIEVEVKMG